MTETKVISFRAHKNLESWLISAGSGFKGGKTEILKLILIRAALEQTPVGGLGQLLEHIVGNNRQTAIGDTKVYAIRLPIPDSRIIRDAAAAKRQGVSEWCASALFRWYEAFKQYKEAHQEQDGWLIEYSRLYREKVAGLSDVYAQKAEGAVI